MKYFYTDPLKAAWQVQNHEFKTYIELPFGSKGSWEKRQHHHANEVLEECLVSHVFSDSFWSNIDLNSSDKIYIHPDCHELLKPQVGDLVQEVGSTLTGYLDGFKSGGRFIIEGHTNKTVINIKIIQRKGLPFFMPEVENA